MISHLFYTLWASLNPLDPSKPSRPLWTLQAPINPPGPRVANQLNTPPPPNPNSPLSTWSSLLFIFHVYHGGLDDLAVTKSTRKFYYRIKSLLLLITLLIWCVCLIFCSNRSWILWPTATRVDRPHTLKKKEFLENMGNLKKNTL